MKKYMKTFLSMVTFGAAMSLFAADPEVDTACIYEIRPCYGPENDYKSCDWPMSKWNEGGKALDASKPLYFNARLIVPSSNRGPYDERNGFSLNYTGSQWPVGSDEYKQDYLQDSTFNPYKMGIFVNGELDYATFETIRPTPSKSGGECYDLFDVVFKYVPKTGDFALPIRLACRDNKGNIVPAPENYDVSSIAPDSSYVFGNGNKWSIRYTEYNRGTGTPTKYTANMRFIDASATESYTADSPDSDNLNGNYSLKQCGFYVKTVDFEDNDEARSDWEDPAYWKSLKKGSVATYYLEALGPVVTNRPSLWVWSDNQDAAKIANGTLKSVTMYKADGSSFVTNIWMAEVKFQSGSSVSSGFRVQGVESNKTANLTLSGFDYYSYQTSGYTTPVMTTNFVVVPLRITAPAPCSLTLSRVSDVKAYNVTSNFAERLTQMKLVLSEAYTNNMVVTVAPVLATPGPYLTNQIVRVNNENVEDGWVKGDPVKVEFTGGEKTKLIDVYGMGADNAYTASTGHEVMFKIVDIQPPAARDFVKSTIDNAAFLYFKPDAPVIANKDELARVTVRGDEPEPLSILIGDNFTDVNDAKTGYTVKAMWWDDTAPTDNAFNKNAFALTTADGKISTFKPDDSQLELPGTYARGILTALKGGTIVADEMPVVPASVGGAYLRLRIEAPNASKSAYLDVAVSKKAKPWVELVAKEDETDYEEGSDIDVYVHFSEPTKKGKGYYAYVWVADTNQYAKLGVTKYLAKEGTKGLKISDETTDTKSFKLNLDDGATGGEEFEFGVVLCTNSTFSANCIDTVYATNTVLLARSVYNVVPTLTEVSLNDGTPGVFVGEEKEITLRDVASVGAKSTFSFIVDDPSDNDLKSNAEGSRFQLKYTMVGGGTNVAETTLYGDPNSTNLTFKFTAKDEDAVLTLWTFDKDMTDDSKIRKAVKREVHFVVSDKPYVQVVTPDGETSGSFDEDRVGDPDGKLKVAFFLAGAEYRANKDIQVTLTVSNSATSNPGKLKLRSYASMRSYDGGVYTLTVPSGQPSVDIYIDKDADGTENSAFTIWAEVTEPGFSPEGPTWQEYFNKKSSPFTIKNVPPTLSVSLPMTKFDESGKFRGQQLGYQNTATNALSGVIGDNDPITWSVSDVLADLGTAATSSKTNITVTWRSEGRTVTTNVTSDVDCVFVPNFKTGGKAKVVTVTVTDKDKKENGTTSAAWYYDVVSSKTLTTLANGPASSESPLSQRYAAADGVGKGHVYADAQASSVTAHEISWNCGLSKVVNCYAWGYKATNRVDNGWLNGGLDVAIAANGNSKSKASSASVTAGYYTYDDTVLDSFLYCWLQKVSQSTTTSSGSKETSSSSMSSVIFGTLTPERTLAAVTRAQVSLPTEEDKEGGYTPIMLEAVFSKEWLPADNMGDINADGVPDVYVSRYKFNVLDSTGAVSAEGDDLARLDTYNEDADYLPNIGSATFAHLIPALSNTWVKEGRAFTAKLEIRGWGTNLNDAVTKPYVKVPNVKPDMNVTDAEHTTFSPLEWDAYVQAGQPAGWSPERPTDPTMLDTDGDGLPDGYEYYIWYKATVGYMDNDVNDAFDSTNGVHKYLTGRRYNPADPTNPTIIEPSQIASLYDPLTPLGADYDTLDTDWDGIPDAMEFLLGTNPVDFDTDGDGLPDGYEVVFSKTDPLKVDTDGNGTADGAENPDNDSMAVYDEAARIVGVLGSDKKTTEYYCCFGTNEFATAVAEEDKPCTRLEVWDKKDDKKITTNVYFTTQKVTTYDVGGKKCLIGDLVGDTWTGRTADGSTALLRGTPARLSRGTLFDSVAEAKYYEETVASAPGEFYVAFPYNGGYARGRKAYGGVAKRQVVAAFTNIVKVMHYHVYQTHKFDPRTGWCHEANFAPAVETAPYTHMDEFLSLVFWYNAGTIPADKLVPTANRPMTSIWSAYTTSPVNADTDGDKMPDGWEFYLMSRSGEAAPDSKYSPKANFNALTSPSDRDNESDALEWPQEYSGILSSARYGWTPDYPDWRNKEWPTDPWNGDTDGDGLLDGVEGGLAQIVDNIERLSWAANVISSHFRYNDSGTAGGMLNPLSVDTDLDRLPDPWEVEFYGTYTATAETVTDTKVVGGVTTTVERIVMKDATWNMDGMDGTVSDARLDYDNDGLANWQEYMVGAMRCWRYDDAVTPWVAHKMSMDDIEAASLAGDEAWGQFWYDRLVDTESADYNPTLANGYLSGVSAYFTCCANKFDPAYGGWYMYCDGVDHDLEDWPNRYVAKAAEEWADEAPYSISMYSCPQQYICCNPKRSDTDFDGMDDYYELFHGLNPILGEPGVQDMHWNGERDTPYDVVFNAYLNPPEKYSVSVAGTVGSADLPPTALNNWWRNGKANHATVRLPEYKKGSASDGNKGYDFIANPWLNGIAGADPDGDNIVNQEESIMPKVQAASTYHHSDPTPLWMTDSGYTNSLTRRCYRMSSPASEEDCSFWALKVADTFAYGGKTYEFKDFPAFSNVMGTVTFEYDLNPVATRTTLGDDWWHCVDGWMFSFEENEGYDSDHDFLSDLEEAQGRDKPVSNPLDHDDPLRRQAMYLNGVDAFLQTPIAEEEVVPCDAASAEARQNFLYYTVECWAKPDADVLATTDGSVYTLVQRTIWADNSSAADEKLLRRNFMIGVRDGKWYTCFDSSATDAKQTVEILDGAKATTEWTHVAATFDGEQLKLYVNGVCLGGVKNTSVQPEHGMLALSINKAGEMNGRGGSVQQSASCITLTVGASPVTQNGIIFDRAWRYRNYQNVTAENPMGLASQTRFSDYGNFFKGYVDEVRVWDGARSAYDIGQDYENRVRYTAELAEQNREAVFAQWTKGGLRSPASPYQLPPQLMYHFAFDHLAGAVLANDVIQVPAGFNADRNVTDAKARWSRPDDWVANGWSSVAVRSKVYADAAWVPWINNTVSHLPRFDLTTLDSVYWSEDYAGATTAATNGYASFGFPRSNEVYSRWTQQRYADEKYFDCHYDPSYVMYNDRRAKGFVNITTTRSATQKTRWNTLSGYNESVNTNYVVVLNDGTQRLRFAARDRNVVGDDILPMGGAYPRRISTAEGGMWDARQGEEPKASDAWAETGRDGNINGLPDWWEEYARNNYCPELPPSTPLKADTPVNYYGVTMPALKAYKLDIIKGIVKIGNYIGYPEDENGKRIYEDTRDTDRDGIPDWWEEFNNLDPVVADGGDDPDGDGLSNYAEYLISEVFKFAELDPNNPKTDGSCVDYFRKPEGGELYFGEMFTDHDQVDDQWEQTHNANANRYVYDPSRDDDGDGWCNRSEAKVGTHPGAVASPGVGYAQPEYPIPVVAAKVVYSGMQKLAGALVFQAWNQVTDPGMTGVPDAEWTSDSLGLTNATRYVGINPGKTCSYCLGTGSVSPGTVCIRFRDMAYETATLIGETASNTNSAESGYANWYPVVLDNGYGELYTSVSNMTRTKVGTVDYATGKVVVDFGCDVLQGYAFDRAVNGDGGSDTTKRQSGVYSNADMINLSRSYVKIEWTPVKIATSGNATYYLSAATGGKGYLREGLSKFVVFCDNDGSGTYTPGEPFGFVRDVDVGWQGGSFAVQLTETSPVFARIDLKAGGTGDSAGESDDAVVVSDRQVWQEGASTVTDISADKYSSLREEMGVTCKDVDLSNTRLTRIRVLRVLVDGKASLGVDKDGHKVPVKGVVLDKYLDLGTRSYLHEGDFLTDGSFDVGWAQTQDQILDRSVYENKVMKFLDATNVTYAIVIGEGEISNSNKVFRCVVNRVYDTVVARYMPDSSPADNTIRPVIDHVQPQAYVYGACPTFRWAMQDGYGRNYDSYTAFKLQVTSGGSVVYDSGFRLLPPRDATGWYSWTLDEPIGSVIPSSGNYGWRVSMYNAKYSDDTFWDDKSDYYAYLNGGKSLSMSTWSECGSFVVDMNNQQAMNDHGYSTIAATVKYAGPEVVLSKVASSGKAGKCVLQAFTTADFAGAPVGEAFVMDKAELVDTSHNMTNAVIKGIPQTGTYYLRAFIDSNGNGRKDDFESWGAAAEPVTLTKDVVVVPTVNIYIEDADTDGDWIPDAYEYAKYGNLTTLTGKIVGGDKIAFSGTISTMLGTAGDSQGTSGASLTIFQNKSFITTSLDLDETVSIDAINAAVEKRVDPDTVKITALTLAPDGSKVTLSVAAEVTDSIAGELLGKVYEITSGDKAKVTIHVYRKDSLATANWTEVGPKDASGKCTGFVAEVGRDDVEIDVDLNGYVDMTSGFYKIDVVQ